MGVGDAVVVEIEAHVGCLAGVDLQAFGHRVVVLGQLHRAGLLGLQGLAHRQPVVLGPAPITGIAFAPDLRLRVEVVHVGERSGGEEVVADVADRPLDPALLIAARHGHRARLVAVGGGECQQVGVEADGSTTGMVHALEHGALQVVVEQHPGHAAEGGKRQHMATQEAVHAGVQAEAQEDAARVAQHHHEGHQGPLGAAHHEMAEVTPVHLRLLARQCAQAQVGLGCRARAVAGHEVAEVVGPAGVAAFPHHGVQTAGGQRGELGQGLADEGQIGVDLAGPQRGIGAHHAGLGDHALHRVAVQVQLAGDGADAPAFGLVQAQDLRAQFRGYGHG